MIGNYKIITLCGSTRFKDTFLREQRRLTLEGNIVISVGLFGHCEEEMLSAQIKTMLDDMHKRKIDLADEIFVINEEGYIGNSTKSEIVYAKSKGKKITYLENTNLVKSVEDYIVEGICEGCDQDPSQCYLNGYCEYDNGK